MVFDSELDSDEEDIAADILELSMQGVEPLTHGKSTQSEGSTDLSDLLSILPGTIASLKDAIAGEYLMCTVFPKWYQRHTSRNRRWAIFFKGNVFSLTMQT
jgi:hypothetical protein